MSGDSLINRPAASAFLIGPAIGALVYSTLVAGVVFYGFLAANLNRPWQLDWVILYGILPFTIIALAIRLIVGKRA